MAKDNFVLRPTLFRISYLYMLCQIYDPIVIEIHLYSDSVGTLVSFFLDGIYPDKVSMEQYTFILTASKELPKKCVRYGTTTAKYSLRKHVGVRIPNDAICQAILRKMDAPLISTRLVWFIYTNFAIRNVTVTRKQVYLIYFLPPFFSFFQLLMQTTLMRQLHFHK